MASKKRAPRKHQVTASLSNFSLAKAKSALTLTVSARGRKVGVIEIGRGSLYWKGTGKHRRQRVSWPRFAKMMNRLAYGE
jgi:hypothetical protein